jgi:signal transduction histidine kinase
MRPSSRRAPATSSAGEPIRILLGDDSWLVLAAEATGKGLEYREAVLTKAWLLLRNYWIDLAIVALALANEIEIVVERDTVNEAVQIPLGLLYATPLLARRRFPLGAPAVVFAAFALSVLVDADGLPALDAAFVAALSAMLAMGTVPELRHALAGGMIGLGTFFWVESQLPTPTTAGEYAGTALLFAGIWFVGFLFSSRGRAAREAELRAATAVADERARLARELHDIVGHSVSVMTVQASAVRRLLRPDQEREREALLTVEETGRQALAEMRRLVGVLRRPEEAPALAPQPGLEHVERLVEQAREAGLPTELRIEGEALELAPSADLTAYRLVQEGLTNALKHAGATRAEVLVRYDSDQVEVVVRDDGRGAGKGDGGGHGLVGMRERVLVSGGELHAGPRPEGGFELRARLPVGAR